MKTLSLNELLKDTPSLVTLIKKGEEVTLTENGEQLAKVVPLHTSRLTPRPAGLAQGQFTVPQDFNDPLPEDIAHEFEEV
jgi:antitoxin (DNA-binding transcriptional repressor) of toxin-antitoxin stability system